MSDLPPRVFWTADEYKAIARKLLPTYPHAMEGHLPGITTGELSRAVQAALPKERQRRMANQAHITSFTRRMRDVAQDKPIWTGEEFEAKGVIAPAAEAQAQEEENYRAGPRVKWSNEEWDALVRKLHELDPTLDTKPDWLTLSRLNQAAALMARPRKFFSAASPRKFLDDARARLGIGQPRSFPAAPAFKAEPEPAAVSDMAMLADLADPAPAPAPEPAPPNVFAKVEWTRDDWLAIARELHRLFPSANYPGRPGCLVGLDSADVAFAQERVLPLERQRRAIKVASFKTLRADLNQAFFDLAAELAGPVEPLQAAMPVAEPVVAGSAPEPTPAPVLVAAEAPARVAPAVEAPAAGVDPYRAAFAPVVGLLAAEVANMLRPMLTQFINEAVALALAAPAPAFAGSNAPPAPPAQDLPPDRPALAAVPITPLNKHYGDEKPKVEKPKKLVVGIIVNRTSQYQHELEKAFPNLDVRCVETDCKARVDSLAQADKVIGMIRFVNHASIRKVKNLVGDRYTDCNGAMSDLKRLISMWLAARDAQEPVLAVK